MPRAQARRIAEELRKGGYTIPGEDEEPMPMVGLLEVRYFYPADQTVAERLAEDSRQVLAMLGLADAKVNVRDYTGWACRHRPRGEAEMIVDRILISTSPPHSSAQRIHRPAGQLIQRTECRAVCRGPGHPAARPCVPPARRSAPTAAAAAGPRYEKIAAVIRATTPAVCDSARWA